MKLHLSAPQLAVGGILATIGINLTGIDPADVMLMIFVPALLLLKPGLLFARHLQFFAKLAAFAFLILYVISCFHGGFVISFVVNFGVGMLMAIALYYYCLADDHNHPIGNVIAYGFTISTAIYAILGLRDINLGELFFDFFRDGRFLGIAGDPNFNGLMASYVIFITVDQILNARGEARRILISLAMLLISLVTLLFTGSRAAWAAFAVGMIIYLISSRRIVGPRLILTFGAFLGAIIVLSVANVGGSEHVGSVTDRIRTIAVQDDNAEQERFKFVYTRASMKVGEERPLGVGPGMTAQYTGLVNADGQPIGSHNAYVQIFSENGLMCLLVVIILLAVTWVRVFRLTVTDTYLNGTSCRVILAGLTTTAMFGMGHDLIAWRVAWLFPILAILAAFGKRRKGSAFPAKRLPVAACA